MRRASAHDMLRLLGDSEKLNMYHDELSDVIEQTLREFEEEEISDDDLMYVAAAYKPEEMQQDHLSKNRKSK